MVRACSLPDASQRPASRFFVCLFCEMIKFFRELEAETCGSFAWHFISSAHDRTSEAIFQPSLPLPNIAQRCQKLLPTEHPCTVSVQLSSLFGTTLRSHLVGRGFRRGEKESAMLRWTGPITKAPRRGSNLDNRNPNSCWSSWHWDSRRGQSPAQLSAPGGPAQAGQAGPAQPADSAPRGRPCLCRPPVTAWAGCRGGWLGPQSVYSRSDSPRAPAGTDSGGKQTLTEVGTSQVEWARFTEDNGVTVNAAEGQPGIFGKRSTFLLL